mmetsp:Transcript_1620/g.2331  ORF Transcript_1620/g.2331 Transcript_1620/m.2331 type:complete len:132 (+) Transcript_1620:896-1291(+)
MQTIGICLEGQYDSLLLLCVFCIYNTSKAISADGRRLYAVGGSNNHESLASVEFYDVAAGEWKEMRQRLLVPREGLGAVISPNGEKLFAVGGAVRNKSKILWRDLDLRQRDQLLHMPVALVESLSLKETLR